MREVGVIKKFKILITLVPTVYNYVFRYCNFFGTLLKINNFKLSKGQTYNLLRYDNQGY